MSQCVKNGDGMGNGSASNVHRLVVANLVSTSKITADVWNVQALSAQVVEISNPIVLLASSVSTRNRDAMTLTSTLGGRTKTLAGVYLILIELEFAKRIMITIRRRKHPPVQTRNLEERSQLVEGKKGLLHFHRKKSQQANKALLLWK